MSKRFGRQQRKKMRAQVEVLEACNKYEKQKVSEANKELQFVDDVLGNISGLAAKELFHIRNPAEFRSFDIQKPNELTVNPYVGELMQDSEHLYAANFHAHIQSIEPVKLERVRDDIRAAKHFYFTAGDGQWAYAASPEMMQLAGKKAMTQRIATELAGMIEEYWRTGQTFS